MNFPSNSSERSSIFRPNLKEARIRRSNLLVVHGDMRSVFNNEILVWKTLVDILIDLKFLWKNFATSLSLDEYFFELTELLQSRISFSS